MDDDNYAVIYGTVHAAKSKGSRTDCREYGHYGYF